MEQNSTTHDVRCERLEAIIRSLVLDLNGMKERLAKLEARMTNTERANT